MDKIDKMFDKITIFDNREMTRERFRQAVEELNIPVNDSDKIDKILHYVENINNNLQNSKK